MADSGGPRPSCPRPARGQPDAPEEKATPLYVIAPVDAAGPPSPPIEVPGLVSVGGRDHVVPARGGGGTAEGLARTVALQHPGWYGGPPFDEAACAPPAHDDRIAWSWVAVGGATGHPCGRVAFVFAVQLDGESCPLPLTDVERVRGAIAQGLVNPFEPDEGGPWPYAIRPGNRSTGAVTPAGGACVAGGERG